MQKMFFPSSANNYNANPFSYIPSSSSYHPLESNDILFNHHHDLVPASSMLPVANPQQQLNLDETLLNMALGNHQGFGFPVKKAVKKDRHRKICTAQGVRDRRVRLSIEIAREFFDLQDMLGFDKASKTVEWLLKKSENAIQEAVKMKQYENGCAYEDPYETVAENGVLDEGTAFQSDSLELDKRIKRLPRTAAPLLAKESRAKARARARERTREKMCNGSGSANSLTQLEISKKSDHLAYGYNNHSMASSSYRVVEQPSTAAAARENVNEESIVITRMVKPSTILGYHQNYLATSKDASFNSNANNGFPNLSRNMDINGANAMAHSTLCAITSVNLSTAGVQLYGKP